MSRLTRREMKRDEVREALGRTVEYSRNHARTIVLAVVAVIAVAIAVAGFYTWRKAAIDRTNEKLAAAMKVYEAPVDAEAPQPDDPDDPVFASEEERRARAEELFDEVRAGSGGVADVAFVYMGRIAAEEGDSGRARSLWQRFLDRHEDHLMAGSVRVSLLALDRVEGDPEEVAARLETMLDLPPEDRPLPGDVVLYELGQTYEWVGRDDDAASIYQRLAEEYPRSTFAAAVRSKAAPSPTSGSLQVGGV